jgi:hypothetical protein
VVSYTLHEKYAQILTDQGIFKLQEKNLEIEKFLITAVDNLQTVFER